MFNLLFQTRTLKLNFQTFVHKSSGLYNLQVTISHHAVLLRIRTFDMKKSFQIVYDSLKSYLYYPWLYSSYLGCYTPAEPIPHYTTPLLHRRTATPLFLLRSTPPATRACHFHQDFVAHQRILSRWNH